MRAAARENSRNRLTNIGLGCKLEEAGVQLVIAVVRVAAGGRARDFSPTGRGNPAPFQERRIWYEE